MIDDAAEDASRLDASRASFDEVLDEIASCDAARFDAALHAVAWDRGWPLDAGAGDGRWLFATRLDEGARSVSVVGDFEGWDESRLPATRCDATRWFVVVDAADVTTATGSKYKWYVADDGSYRAPAEATQYGFDGFGRFGWVRAPLDQPHLEQFPDFRSAHLAEPRAFRAFVPTGFVAGSSGAAHARTLLLHDGQNVFHPDAFFGGWHVDDALRARGDDVIAIAVDNASDRMDAYTQVVDDIGSGTIGGRADDYLALLEDEALPFFRARYGIVARGASLMVAGSSLGGLITLVAAERDFAAMGCGAALSSTVGWGSIDPSARSHTSLVETWTGLHAPLYLDTGGGVNGSCLDADADGLEDDGDDADNYCVNQQFLGVLERAGYEPGRTLERAWEPDAPHNEAAWAGRIGEALDACAAMGWRAP
ncbi:MAG: hypothetical protein K1X94_02385 [Sandaracinaceae bacterium]|nr:hypothetical protein [Sandaracinaceae bacterium]